MFVYYTGKIVEIWQIFWSFQPFYEFQKTVFLRAFCATSRATALSVNFDFELFVELLVAEY